MFTIDIVSLFPEVFAPFVGLSIVGRAVEAGKIDVRYHHILDALEGNERADDIPYGGGPGMVMRIEPIARILDGIRAEIDRGDGPSTSRAPHATLRMTKIILTSPAGKPFVQADAERFAKLDRLTIVCGHYEGIDERLSELYPIEEYSLGDFVLTGGEIPALAMIDATVRLVEGVVNPESLANESFSNASDNAGHPGAGSLDYPAYTRPPIFRGISVPEVLLSGDHAKIAAWRREQSRQRTIARKGSQETRDTSAS